MEGYGAWAHVIRSMTPVQFNQNMNTMKLTNSKAHDWLNDMPKESWTKAYFDNSPKVDNICNNCEVFNAKILAEKIKANNINA